MEQSIDKYQLVDMLLEAGAVEIRDVDNGDEPFLYSSGNRGPGYVNIKGMIGFDGVFEAMVDLLAEELIENNVAFEAIVGMATGGMLPGYRLKQIIQRRCLGRHIKYLYQRGARKTGGHGELDTGDRNNPNFNNNGMNMLIVEELVNFAQTTCNGALYERSKGRVVTNAATILFYENPAAIRRLQQHKIKLYYVITLRELLWYGAKNGCLLSALVDEYLKFLDDPKKWNIDRGFEYKE